MKLKKKSIVICQMIVVQLGELACNFELITCDKYSPSTPLIIG